MAKLLFGTAALCLFIGALSPLHAQGGVFLRACNAGKVDIDVVLWQSGKVSNTHIGSADCASIAETTGSMAPASVGFAFSDSKGQWGAARRLDLLPDLGLDVLKESPRNIIVQHANHNVPFQTQLLFQPRVPTCQTYQSHSAVARLPLNATHAHIAAAQAEDANSPPASTVC